MYIKKESINDVFEKAKEKFQKTGLRLNSDSMKRFENELAQIAEDRAYKEGEKIDNLHLSKIVNEVGLVINTVIADMVKNENSSPMEQLMGVTDYLYAMTMQKLGCPDIPASFGAEMKRSVGTFATTINSHLTLKQSTTYGLDVYLDQRGKDASVVLEELSEPLNAAKESKATPTQVQKLIAEYQALQKRQNDHGFFWRMFHPVENGKRQALLTDMETALKGMLGENLNLVKCNSLTLAEGMLGKSVAEDVKVAFADDGMSERIGVSAEAFAGSDVMKNANESTQELRNSLAQALSLNDKQNIQAPENKKAELSNQKTMI